MKTVYRITYQGAQHQDLYPPPEPQLGEFDEMRLCQSDGIPAQWRLHSVAPMFDRLLVVWEKRGLISPPATETTKEDTA